MNKFDLVKECVQYFKSDKGFDRLLKKTKSKYESLGRIGGNIILNSLSDKEKIALTGFLRSDFISKSSAVIRIEDIQQAINKTKYEGVNLIELLQEYFKEELISNKEKRHCYYKTRKQYFDSFINKYKGTKAGDWLIYICNSKKNAYNILCKRYKSNLSKLSNDIDSAANAVNILPIKEKEKINLAVFASKITKDPHAFDEGTVLFQLLIFGIMFLCNKDKPENAEEKAELLYDAGIIIDELSNFTICVGLSALKNNKVHEGWQGFYANYEPIHISLMNLNGIDRIICNHKKVFVVENPAVFTSIYNKCFDERIPLICTYGQVNIASYMLLDKLVDESVVIYYSGDFDPEGLMIADKLKSRYKDRLILWRYNVEDYIAACSNRKVSEVRLKKLYNIKSERLQKIANEILKRKLAGYQEIIIRKFIKDITIYF